MSPSLSLSVPPEVALMAYVPGSSKMIEFLELIHVLQLTRSDETGPKTVPGSFV